MYFRSPGRRPRRRVQLPSQVGWAGSHRAVCKWYKHHFPLLVLICSNGLARPMGSRGGINRSVCAEKCRRNSGNKLQLFTFCYAERLDAASRLRAWRAVSSSLLVQAERKKWLSPPGRGFDHLFIFHSAQRPSSIFFFSKRFPQNLQEALVSVTGPNFQNRIKLLTYFCKTEESWRKTALGAPVGSPRPFLVKGAKDLVPSKFDLLEKIPHCILFILHLHFLSKKKKSGRYTIHLPNCSCVGLRCSWIEFTRDGKSVCASRCSRVRVS